MKLWRIFNVFDFPSLLTSRELSEFVNVFISLPQYGQIHVAVRELVLEKFGEDNWKRIL